MNNKHIFHSLILIITLIINNITLSAQSNGYRISGIVTDAETGKALEAVLVKIQKTKRGVLTDTQGHFSLLSPSGEEVNIQISAMGYRSKSVKVAAHNANDLRIQLQPSGISLQEVIVNRRGKEKYSKKNNPAVELIRKVIARKDSNYIDNEQYRRMSVYERLLFSLNNYEAGKGLIRGKVLEKYADSSKLDNKKILPFSLHERYYDIYARKQPADKKKIVMGYNKQGIDEQIDVSGFEQLLEETIKDVNLRNNEVQILMQAFVGPLSSTSAIDFFRWYIRDTVQVNGIQHIQLGFLPFNTNDLGFSGDIFVRNDASYAVQKVQIRIPKKANINFVKDILIEQEFAPLPNGVWAPKRYDTFINLDYLNIGKVQIQKQQHFTNVVTGMPNDFVFANTTPEVTVKDFDKQPESFWQTRRPTADPSARNLNAMMGEIRNNKSLNFLLQVADVMTTGYLHSDFDPEKNKLDFGPVTRIVSRNNVEGLRLRMGVHTTANVHRQFFAEGYGAYGFADHRWKYGGQLTWSFHKKKNHKDEFPRNNFSIKYKDDVNVLGRDFMRQASDNIVRSFKTAEADNMVYQRTFEAEYLKEWHKGLTFAAVARTNTQQPAGGLQLGYNDASGAYIPLNELNTTEAGIRIRYHHNQKFIQRKEYRKAIPTEYFIFNLESTWGLKNVLGGNYKYNRTELMLSKSVWMPPFGKLFLQTKGQKVWGQVPYPLLITPNANNSYTLQKESFNLATPLEFLHDKQVEWHLDYFMGGWLLNRIPLINRLKLREVFGVRGFWGGLNRENNPALNPQQMLFPEITQPSNSPYWEYNVGIENIFQLLRVDYVHRLSHLQHHGIKKQGFRIGFRMTF